MSVIILYEWVIIVFVIGVIFFCVFMFIVLLFFGGKLWGCVK